MLCIHNCPSLIHNCTYTEGNYVNCEQKTVFVLSFYPRRESDQMWFRDCPARSHCHCYGEKPIQQCVDTPTQEEGTAEKGNHVRSTNSERCKRALSLRLGFKS